MIQSEIESTSKMNTPPNMPTATYKKLTKVGKQNIKILYRVKGAFSFSYNAEKEKGRTD